MIRVAGLQQRCEARQSGELFESHTQRVFSFNEGLIDNGRSFINIRHSPSFRVSKKHPWMRFRSSAADTWGGCAMDFGLFPARVPDSVDGRFPLAVFDAITR